MVLKLTFVPVGNGDSIVLEWTTDQGEAKIAFVDCNRFQGRVPSLDYLRDLNPRSNQIDFCLLSHPHNDHFSGFTELLNWCVHNRVHIRRFWHTCASVPEFLKSAVRTNTDITALSDLFKLVNKLVATGAIEQATAIGGDPDWVKQLNRHTTLQILAPTTVEINRYTSVCHKEMAPESGRNNPDANYLSTILKITVPDGYVLLTADAPEEVFRRLDKDPVGNSTEHRNRLLVGQIPHHGSEGSFQRSFWQNRYHAGGKAVISCGPNGYGHPSPAVLEKLNEIKYQVYRTDGHRPEKTSNQRRALESVSKARYPSSAPALEPVRFTC